MGLPQHFWIFFSNWCWLPVGPGGLGFYYDRLKINSYHLAAITHLERNIPISHIEYNNGKKEHNDSQHMCGNCKVVDFNIIQDMTYVGVFFRNLSNPHEEI